MNRLQLHDRVTITSTLTGSDRPGDVTVRAHVYTVSSVNPDEDMSVGYLVEQLRAIIGPPPRELDPNTDRVVHRGVTYPMDGRPMARYRRGKLHHLTINLERTSV